MKSNMLRTKSDLPKWFDLKKYVAVKGFTPDQWLEQVLIRSAYLFWLKADYSPYGLENSNYLKTVQSARKNPVINLVGFKDDMGAGLRALTKIKDKEKLLTMLSVSPVTIGQLIDAYRGLPVEIREPKANINELAYETLIDLNYLETELLRIDLRTPDDILIDQFKIYLRQRRRKSKFKSKPYVKPDYKKWKEYHLLPYMDLKIWSLENRKPISQKAYMQALFPDSSESEDKVRKTLDPIVRQIINRFHSEVHTYLVAGNLLEPGKK